MEAARLYLPGPGSHHTGPLPSRQITILAATTTTSAKHAHSPPTPTHTPQAYLEASQALLSRLVLQPSAHTLVPLLDSLAAVQQALIPGWAAERRARDAALLRAGTSVRWLALQVEQARDGAGGAGAGAGQERELQAARVLRQRRMQAARSNLCRVRQLAWMQNESMEDMRQGPPQGPSG